MSHNTDQMAALIDAIEVANRKAAYLRGEGYDIKFGVDRETCPYGESALVEIHLRVQQKLKDKESEQ